MLMDGFEKIELESPTAPQASPAVEESSTPEVSKKRRFSLGVPRFRGQTRKRKAGIIAGVIFLLFIFLILIPGFFAALSARNTYKQLKITVAALKTQDIDKTQVELKNTRANLKDTQTKLNLLFVLGFIPGPNIYYNDAKHLVKAGLYGLDAADTSVAAVKPYADVLGLKGQGSYVAGTAQNRIETAVKTMGKVTPKVDDIDRDLKLAKTEIDYVNPKDYPSFIAHGKVRKGMETLRTLADDGTTVFDQAKPLIKVLPSLLGEPKEKKYLVIFQNDKELRPSGGFITAYAIFRVDKGVIHVDRSEDIYTLDATIGSKPKAPEPILKYLPKVFSLNLRDSNLSPDFQKSMETFRQLYAKSNGPKDVDGIIALDTSALVDVMNVLGDVQVNGTTYSTKLEPKCNCPQVIYAIEEYAGLRTSYIRPERKSLIGDLMYAIMNKAFSSSPKLYWGPLMQVGMSDIAKKHVLFSLNNKDAQLGLSAVNAAGEIKKFDGDYLHINEANFGGDKANLFIDQKVAVDYSVGKDGTVTKTVTVTYKNPFKPSNCNLEALNSLCLNADFRDWIRFYVPEGSRFQSVTGSEVKMTTYKELGKTVFDGFLTVRPLGIGRITLKYTLPFKVAKGSVLPVMIQKQPGTDNDEYTISLNGKPKEQFILDTDKTFDLNIK
jgi:hypothetical protein